MISSDVWILIFFISASIALPDYNEENELALALTKQPHESSLDKDFTLQQIYFPLDGLSQPPAESLLPVTSPAADSNLVIVFPNGAATIQLAENTPNNQALVLDGKTQYGLLKGAFNWIYDLDKSPTGITVLFNFQLTAQPKGPAFLLSTGDVSRDPLNAAGFAIWVDPESSQVKIRFGYSLYKWECACRGQSGQSIASGSWYSVHASCRNYFGLLQYSVAVDSEDCSKPPRCQLTQTAPNYDASRIDTLYLGLENPTSQLQWNVKEKEPYSPMMLDNIRIFNTFTEFKFAVHDSSELGHQKTCCSAEERKECEPCQTGNTKTITQMTDSMEIEDTCTDLDGCTYASCDYTCTHLFPPQTFQCGCPANEFLSEDKRSCGNTCTGVYCYINTECSATTPQFQCNCNALSAGRPCERKQDLCHPNPCKHGGMCIADYDKLLFNCTCPAQYIGKDCDEEITDCARQPCRHGGTCVLTDDDAGFKCNCLEDYDGSVCERMKNPCDKKNCANNAPCFVLNDIAICDCPAGKSGDLCDQSQHPCKPNPCLYGGQCSPTPDRLHAQCQCRPGLNGTKCQNDIDECKMTPQPCQAKATCLNTVGSFDCRCPKGFAPPDCTQEMDLCKSNPCQNLGTCTNQVGAYVCTCPPEYVGVNCEIKGADRCTVESSHKTIVAGNDVFFILQCALLGDNPSFYYNMGDRLYFFLFYESKSFPKTAQDKASQYIYEQTKTEITLHDPEVRFVYIYRHWFSGPGDYPLTVQIYNKDYPSAKYITAVNVTPNSDPCFPAVAIVNGGFNVSTGPPFQRSYPFVIQSVVTIPHDHDCPYTVTYSWKVYQLTVDNPMPSPANVQTFAADAAVATDKSYLQIGANLLPYGSYMNVLDVTLSRLNKESKTITIRNLDRGWFNITATPLKVTIKGGAKRSVGNSVDLVLDGTDSFDPDESAKLSCETQYYWFGYQDDTSPAALPSPIPTTPVCSNFPSCSGYLQQPDVTTKKVTLSGSSLPAGVYTFQLVGEVGKSYPCCKLSTGSCPVANIYRTVATQEVTVVAGAYADLTISCTKSNCATRIDAGERFSLEASCATCPAGSTFSWTVYSSLNDTFDDFIWQNGMEFNKTEKLLAVRPEVLPAIRGVTYTFLMTATPPTGNPVTAEYSVQINMPPAAGTCKVDPEEGYGLETFFSVDCAGFTDDDLPLTYRFHYKNGDEVIATDHDAHGQDGTLLYYNIDPHMPPTLLPHGLPENNYTGKLYIIVHDSFETITQVTYLVKVTPRNRTAAETDALFKKFTDDGILDQIIKAGDHQGTAQTAVVLSTELNHMAEHRKDEQPLALATKTKIRDKLMASLDDLPVHSLSALQQVAASISQVAAVPAEISPEAQFKATDLLGKLREHLDGDIKRGIGPFELHETAAYIVSAATNVIAAVDIQTALLNPHRDPPEMMAKGHLSSGPLRQRRDATMDPKLQQAKDNSNNLLKVLHSVMDTYGTTKLVGEDPTEFTTPDLHVGVSELFSEDINGKLRESSMKDYFTLPELKNLGPNPVQVQSLYSLNNLYSWDPSGSDINTPNVELSFKDSKANKILDVKDLPEPIHITLPLKNGALTRGFPVDEAKWSLAMPAEFYSSMNLTVQKVTVPKDKTIIVCISAARLEGALSVLISEGSKPSLEDHKNDRVLGTIQPFESNVTVERYFQLAASERSADNTTYYVSMAAGDIAAYLDRNVKKSVEDPPDGSVVNVTYTLSIFSAACLYWSDTAETWKTDGCKVSNLTTKTTLHCDCNHLTTFAAGLFVLPNHVDPIKDIKLILSFFDNPVVGCIVVAIWVIYFAMLIYARRLDVVEEAKRGVHVLTDNDASHPYYYVITVCTGLRFGATTTAKVGMVLKGTRDQSDPHILNEVADMEFFQMGGEDSFLLAVQDSLGDLMALSIWHNGEGIQPSWFVDEVLVRDIQTNQLYFFLPNRWLAAHKADRQLSVEVPAATGDDLTSFWHRFTSFTSRGLRDSHLYFSVLYRPSRSTFTRAQRLTCILSLFLTTMLASFMFYQPIADPADQRSSYGFTFNFRQIMVGIQSGLIALPVNVLVIQCFAKAAPKKGGKRVEEEDLPKGHRLPGQFSKTFLDPAVVKLLATDTQDHVFLKPPKRDRVEDSAYITHAKRPFPYWTAYVAWVTAISTAVVASYFVFLYGLRFGRTASMEWTVSFFSAIFQDVVINQPLKVLAVSALIALILRKPPERDPEGTVVAYPDLKAGVLSIAQRLRYRPPSPEWIEAVRRISLLTKRLNQWLVDIGWFLVFMVSVFMFTYGNTPIGGFGLTQALETSFQMLQGQKGFMDVHDVKGMWNYLETTFMDGLHPKVVTRRGLAPKAGHYIADMVNIVLGPARVRQVRIRRENCLHDDRVDQLNVTCLPAYSPKLHETRPFEPGWIFPHTTSSATTQDGQPVMEDDPVADESEVDYLAEEEAKENVTVTPKIFTPWSYQTAAEIGMGSYSGEQRSYKGGGYIAILPHSAKNATAMLKDLEKAGWVDDLTRAVFVQFNTYNPNANLFTITVMLFEFDQSGLILPYYTMDVMRLFIADKKLHNLIMGFGLFASLLLVIFTGNMVHYITRTKLKYFKDIWNWLDMVIVFMGWLTFGLYFTSRRTKLAAVKLVTQANPERFVGFYFAMLTEVAFINMSAFCFFVCTIKLLKILRITRKINTLLYVLANVAVPLLGFFLSFFISVLPFVMAGHVIFGRSLKRNATFYSSFITIMRIVVVDAYDLYEEYSGVEALLGPLYFATAVISVLYIYTNILLALIMVIYSRTLEEYKDKIEQDAQLSDFLVQRVQELLGIMPKHPVVDLSQFPAAVELRDLSDVFKKFERKPHDIEGDDWGNFLNLAELRKLTSVVVEDIRTVEPDPQRPLGFRTDYIPNSNEWYYVETHPAADVQGPSTIPVNRLLTATALMEGSVDMEEFHHPSHLDREIKKSIRLYRNMIITSKLSVILINLPPSKKRKRKKKGKGHRSKQKKLVPQTRH